MRALFYITVAFISYSSLAQNQNSSPQEGYLLMKVNGDILDCPHFCYLLPQELNLRKKIKLLKTDHKTYMLFKTNNYTDSLSNDFYEIVKMIYFPKENIEELVIKKDYNAIIHLVGE